MTDDDHELAERRRIGEELQQQLPPARPWPSDSWGSASDPPRDWPLWKATRLERLAGAAFAGGFFFVTGAGATSSAIATLVGLVINPVAIRIVDRIRLRRQREHR